MRDLFSSAAASHSFAGRAVREVSKHNLAVLDRLSDAIKPVHKEIMQRGKLPRERVQPSFDAIRRHLTGCPNVVALECAVYAPSQHRLSSREGRSMRLIMLTSDPDTNADERVDFLAFDVMLARHEITVRVEMLDLSVSTHVLARFMQRRQKGLLDFFGGIMSPLKTASVLVSSALVHPSGRIALPHEDGLLLGEVTLYDESDEDGRLPFVRTYDRAGRRTTPAESSARVDGTRSMAHIRTFVDTDSLSPAKEALRDRLRAWEQQQMVGIDAFFEGRAFGTVRIKQRGTEREAAEALRCAVASSLDEIPKTPEWTRFASQEKNDDA